MSEQKGGSGLDSLLDALKQSGMNVDGMGGRQASSSGSASEDSSARTSETSDADSSKRGFGGGPSSPFVNPFEAFMGGFGGQRHQGDDGDGNGGGRGPINASFRNSQQGPMSKKSIAVLAVVAVLVILALYWWFHPAINIHSTGTWGFVIVFVILPLMLLLLNKRQKYETGKGEIKADPKKAKMYKHLLKVPIVVLLVGIIGGVAGLAIIPGNAARYANILVPEEMTFVEDIKEVNYSEIPIIDRDTAYVLGNKEMGSIPDYVSQFEISPLYSQINYQGEPVRVSPLGYADIFKWFTNREGGIPAYVLVNMTTQDAEVVRLGDSPIHYSQSEPLVRNIDRHVQLKYPFYMFDEKSFEIDEEGHPWWICPVQKRTIGLFDGTTIDRVVLCDATTGECQDLAVEDVPQWVDRVYPSELLIEQYNWHGKYLNGWLNSFLGQSGVVQTTPGSEGQLGYNYIAKDDDVWVYTGVTSATSDSSIVGFVLVNQRTAEAHYYAVAGATELSAMGSAEGQVQNLRYVATFPILINVSNQPTYFMSLKDGEGLVKKFAMIDIQRYQNVAIGDTVAECQKSYQSLLATNGISIGDVQGAGVAETTGTIELMSQAVIEGNSHFYVMLEGDDKLYDFALPGHLDIVGYRVGDKISFSYIDGGTMGIAEEIK